MENVEKFTEICSDQTLYTNPEGFFPNFIRNLIETVGENNWIKKVFGKLKSDEQRISCLYEEPLKPLIDQVLKNVQEVFRKKDLNLALQKRLEADSLFKKGDLNQALIIYSQSILKCPLQELPQNLINRATIHLQKNNPNFALQDLELALKGYNDDAFKGKIFAKLAVAYKMLDEKNQWKNYLKQAKKMLSVPEFRKYEKLMHEISPVASNSVPLKNLNLNDMQSNKVGVKITKEAGRFFVAQETIKTGELLLVEKSYAAVLNPERFGTHCQNCLERLKNAVPCETCSSVAFCTLECRNLAKFHNFECKYLDLLIGSGMSPLTWLALRMITHFDYETLLNNLNGDVYKLCNNSEKRKSVDFFKRTIMAAFLARILQNAKYGGDSRKLAEIILKNLQILQFNAHEITETLQSGSKFKIESIGIGLYPNASFFNHDCYPGVFRVFQGKSIIVRASRVLHEGELIPENYGQIFTVKNLKERQIGLLSRYWFTCECKACRESWPLLKNCETKRVKCPRSECNTLFTLPLSKIDFNCPGCKENISLEEHLGVLDECERKYELGRRLFDKEQFDEAAKVLVEAIDQFCRVSCVPHKKTHLAEDILRKCWTLSGSTFKC